MMDVKITTEFIKLDSLLKFAGEAETGAMAKEIILEGDVFVNNITELRRGRKVYPGDTVRVGDIILNVCKDS